MNFQFKPYRKKENSEPIGALACALETESTGSGKECFKLRSPEARISRTSGGHTEPESSGIKKTVLLKEKNSDIETISAQELKKCMDSKIPLLILDVREESELFGKLGHLENSTNIPLGSLENRLKELEKERDLEIIVVCRSGVRASKAAKFLVRKGFKKVKVLKGGMLAWRDLQT
ncbi:MAG TPA: rhodanese-like domain-containing protein [Methanosarcina sp.]|nr:rhodanese-like domain-containing protein [Methanosarcina sp.]